MIENDVTNKAEHIGYINSLCSCGYYYDQETGLYYLNARYYDPETGRFINADDNLSDLNLYRYCMNNPIMFFDPVGRKVFLIHGTNSGNGTWVPRKSTKFLSYIGELFGEEVEAVDWTGGNNDDARQEGAQKVYSAIADCLKLNPNEPIRLIAHSHGGNVAILAANLLDKETGRQVDTLITIATPVREYIN